MRKSRQRIYSGYGSRGKLSGILKSLRVRKVFLVTGGRSYTASGAKKQLEQILHGREYIRFSCSRSTPGIREIERGIGLLRGEGADLMIGVGGGSVIDVAKAISLLGPQGGTVAEYVRGNLIPRRKKIPLAAVPTTAGAGSESTHFSVVYIGARKHSLAHSALIPDFAVLDPIFLASLPPRPAAISGADALCQGIESFWSTNSTNESKRYSRKAVRLALTNLPRFVKARDKNACLNMLLASNLSGRAIDIAKTTAAHAVSYRLTSRFGIAHGQAVALTLPYFLELNSDMAPGLLQDRRGPKYCARMMKELLGIISARSAAAARAKLVGVLRTAGLETRLSKFGVRGRDLAAIVKHGLLHARMKNNPRTVSRKELYSLLQRIL